MKVAIGADHGGFVLKETLRRVLEREGVEVEDVGCFDTTAVDYPDVAEEVVRRVTWGLVEEGILICTTGIGMSIAANKHPSIRAALCCTPEMAVKARTHNNANVLVLGGQVVSPEAAVDILKAWRSSAYTGVERHERRNRKVKMWAMGAWETAALDQSDPEVADILRKEVARQNETVNLIASENYASRAVREAQGSVLTNKYAEGYPGRRWYDGCEQVDAVERLAMERAKRLFGAEHVNVQPHCGSSANMAVYFAVLQPGDTLLAMNLAHGGHLTHGSPVNFSGRLFRVVGYGVRRDTERIEPEDILRLALEHRPRLIVVGASSYPRKIDFAPFREIADRVGARLMVDMAHIAGLVAGGCHPSPVPVADFVTTTTHKTLRGPRGGAILCRQAYAVDVDRQIFPGTQGGPLMHVIAAKAVCFAEALRAEFAEYARQVVRNAVALAEALQGEGFRLVSGGTDTHLLVVDLTATGLTGRDAASALNRCGLIVNKNVIPFDPRPPVQTSGIRLGSPAVTTRGMKEDEMRKVARLIARVLRAPDDVHTAKAVREEVLELARAFPVE